MDVWELTDREADELGLALAKPDSDGLTVYVAWDGGLKVKIGRGIWSPPLGYRSPEYASLDGPTVKRVQRLVGIAAAAATTGNCYAEAAALDDALQAALDLLGEYGVEVRR